MENAKQNACQCEKAACGCAGTKAAPCVCAERCSCTKGCSCGVGCNCMPKK